MSKEAKKEVVVCDGKDKDSTPYSCKICTVYQGGEVEGHFLKFDGNNLISTAKQEDKSIIKLQSFQGDHNKEQLCLITDPNQADRALRLLNKDDGPSSFIVKENPGLVEAAESYNEVTTNKDFKPFVFKKIFQKGDTQKTKPFYLCSYDPNNKKSFFLAVGKDGHLRMDSPPELPVNGNHDRMCLFRMHSVETSKN